MRKFLSSAFLLLLFASIASAQQKADVTITLNENFFDALLDAVFANLPPPSFPLAETREEEKRKKGEEEVAFRSKNLDFLKSSFEAETKTKTQCDESIRLTREIEGVRTAVRFRDGKINAPIAFTGSYNPPLIGCVSFQGWADSTIDLEFDQNTQSLIGRATVSEVRLSGMGSIGSNFIAKLVQSAIDKKINPIRILQMEKVSFVVPFQNAGSLKMKAVGISPQIVNGAMNVKITYQFSKAQ